MSVQPVKDAAIYLAQYDISGDHNRVALVCGVKELPATRFTQTADDLAAGLFRVSFQANGLIDLARSAHTAYRTNLGVRDVPVTVSPQAGAPGDVALFFPALTGRYQVGAPVGEILAFEAMARGLRVPLVSGEIVVAAGDKTASGSSAGEPNLGAVAAGRRVYAALHVLTSSGTAETLDVVIESDDTSGFLTPTTRLTFPQATGPTSGWQQLDGPITDGWWRAIYTIGGTDTPTFSFVVAIGIF